MKNLTDFRKTVETGVDPGLRHEHFFLLENYSCKRFQGFH